MIRKKELIKFKKYIDKWNIYKRRGVDPSTAPMIYMERYTFENYVKWKTGDLPEIV